MPKATKKIREYNYDPVAESSYTHAEAISNIESLIQLIIKEYNKNPDNSIEIDKHKLKELLLLIIDDRLTLYYSQLKSKRYTEKQKGQIEQQQEEFSDLHDYLILLNSPMKEIEYTIPNASELPSLPRDLAMRLKEHWGWEYPILEEGTNTDNFSQVPIDSEFFKTPEEAIEQIEAEKRYQNHLSSIEFTKELTSLPEELAKRVFESWGWIYPVSSSSEHTDAP